LFRRRSLASALAIATSVACFAANAPEAQAQELRYSTTAPGGIASTGNTLGLSKASAANGPGVQDSIGAFISLDPNSQDNNPLDALNPWPMSTTDRWTQNGSLGVLALPMNSTVLYAELVWAGSYNYYPEDVSGNIDDAITFGFEGEEIAVSPASATATTIAETSYTGFAANYYIRSADVTGFVQQHGAGSYTVSGVPATQSSDIDSLSAAGWSLVVAYRSDEQPIRNLSVFVGGSFVDEDATVDYTVDGFCAPPYGDVEGNVVVSALEGDADLIGDELWLGADSAGQFYVLAGPNNPDDNFFSSQINDANGNLDTAGSFGDVNHDAFNGVNVAGARQGWDLTSVAVSSADGYLVNGQTSAVIRTATSGDSYVPTLVAMELDVKSPDFTGSGAEADKSSVKIGDTVTFTATLNNVGEATAANLAYLLPVDSGLELVSFTTDGASGDIDGNAVNAGGLDAGVPEGLLDVNQTRQVVATFNVVGAPPNGQTFLFSPTWEHSFQVCAGDPAIAEMYSPPAVQVQYSADATPPPPPPPVTGGNGTGGGPPVDDGFGNDEMIDEEGSCGCTTPGRSSQRGWLAMVLAGIGLAASRRRRRN
jgi:uncharacterized repeat protein (TIGR01451 family)/MYXO-CTERM domain-containing protein